jgi:glycosyltransferase involved in cell wall biosynthesis
MVYIVGKLFIFMLQYIILFLERCVMVQTLGCALIVRNEEHYLPQCLKSIDGVDELIVADTGSEDKTVEIAESFGAKVYTDYKWNDNFAEARNYALSKSTIDWLLVIDADEYLEPGGIEKIRNVIEGVGPEIKTIYVKMVARGNGASHNAIRLHRRCPEVYWCAPVHNYLSVSSGPVTDIKITYSYSDAHAKDPDRAMRILTKYVTEHPTCGRERFYLAREFWYRKYYQKALDTYKEYLKVATWQPEICDALLMCARSEWALGHGDSAREYAMKAVLKNTDFKEAIIFLADVSGPGNKKRWTEFANGANNSGVLFVRNKAEGS